MLGNIIAAGANILGGIMGQNSQERMAEKNIALQREFATQGIQMRVEDAKKAGIHPLAALGAQTTSFSPISVGGSSMAAGLSAAGQDIARAVDSTRSNSAKMDAYAKTIQDLNIRRMGLENDLLSSQIAKINATGPTPGLPTGGDRYLIEGQGNSPLVSSTPLSRTVSAPEAGSQEPGAFPDIGYSRTPSGYAPVMSKDVKDRLEEDFLGMLAWSLRNRLPPTLDAHVGNKPDDGSGDYLVYSPIKQEYVKIPKKRGRYGFPAYYR